MTTTVAAPNRKKTSSPSSIGKRFSCMHSDEFFDQVYFPYQPTQGTLAGYHQYDAKLEDLSQAAINAEIAASRNLRNASRTCRKRRTSILVTRGDCEHRAGQHPVPSAHAADDSSLAEESGRLLLHADQRRFLHHGAQIRARLTNRLRSLVERERQMPGLLDQARLNLANPPHIYTEIAIQQLPGIISFFQHDVPLLSPMPMTRL